MSKESEIKKRIKVIEEQISNLELRIYTKRVKITSLRQKLNQQEEKK